ncbi:MAG: hypothetical protein V2B18_21970, partial [Pseudomonadota bacterium]
REILVNNGLTPDKPGFADAMRKVDALLKGFAVKAPAGGKLPTTDLERIINEGKQFKAGTDKPGPPEVRSYGGLKWPSTLTLAPGGEGPAARDILAGNGLTPDHPNFSTVLTAVEAVLRDFSAKAPKGGKLSTAELERIIKDAKQARPAPAPPPTPPPAKPAPERAVSRGGVKLPGTLTLVRGSERQAAAEILSFNGLTPQHPGYLDAARKIERVLVDFAASNPSGGRLPIDPLNDIIKESRHVKVEEAALSKDSPPSPKARSEAGTSSKGALPALRAAEPIGAPPMDRQGPTPLPRAERVGPGSTASGQESPPAGGPVSTPPSPVDKPAQPSKAAESHGLPQKAATRDDGVRTQPPPAAPPPMVSDAKESGRALAAVPPESTRPEKKSDRSQKAADTPPAPRPTAQDERPPVQSRPTDAQAPMTVENIYPSGPSIQAESDRGSTGTSLASIADPTATELEFSGYMRNLRDKALKIASKQGGRSLIRICRDPGSEEWTLTFCRQAGNKCAVVNCVWNWIEDEWVGFSTREHIPAGDWETYARSGAKGSNECKILK